MPKDKQLEIYDNTMVQGFRTCPRKFYYRHIREWESAYKSKALIFGSGWGSAMDVIWQEIGVKKRKADIDEVCKLAFKAFMHEYVERGAPKIDEEMPEDKRKYDARTPDTALEMIYGYITERSRLLCDPTFKLIAIEQPFIVPLDPKEQLFYCGRFDKVFEYQGKTYIGEHKTTSLFRKNGPFSETFLEGFSPNSQIDGYLYAGHMMYPNKIKSVWVDAALVHKDVHDAFRIIPIERAFPHLDSWLWGTHYWIGEIRRNKNAVLNAKDKYMSAWPQETNSCIDFNQTCSYLDACKVWANPEGKDIPQGFTKHGWSPFDHLQLKKLGLKKGDIKP